MGAVGENGQWDSGFSPQLSQPLTCRVVESGLQEGFINLVGDVAFRHCTMSRSARPSARRFAYGTRVRMAYHRQHTVGARLQEASWRGDTPEPAAHYLLINQTNATSGNFASAKKAPTVRSLPHMNHYTPTHRPNPDSSSVGRSNSEAHNGALQQLGGAIAQLGGDTDWIIRSLTEAILSMRPVSSEGLTEEQKRLLIELDAFTSEELAETMRDVDRGALQLGAVEVFLSHLYGTLSLSEIAGYLGWTEEAARTAAAEGRLYAVQISGQLRFPAWQFSASQEDKLLPGLAELIKVVSPRWSWQSVTAFMTSPQADLIAKGRQTPAEWLRRGGNINAVRAIAESEDWS